MDPAAALLLISLQPARIDPDAALLRGAFLPMMIPLDGLPVATRAAWLLKADRVPAGRRVAALLAADRATDAFRLANALQQPIAGELGLVLSAWASQEQQRLGLPSGDGVVVDLAPGDSGTLEHDVRQTLASVTGTLPLTWPRWAGPLVVVGRDAARDPIPGLTWLARPALPILRCNHHERGAIAADLVGLALALSAPPAQGWPVWLRRGLAEACARRAQGQTASPRDMRQDRQAAGATALGAMLTAAHPEMPLALAVASLLIQPEYRQNFPSFLDLVRNGASSEGALRVAYGWSLVDLATLR